MKQFSIYKVFGSVFLLLGVIIFSVLVDTQWDLTPDKRYTLNPLAKQIVRSTDEPIVITVLLEGNVPASFRNYRAYLDHYLSELRRYDRDVEIVYKDVNKGSPEEKLQFRKFLASRNVVPINRQVSSGDQVSQELLFPYISVHDDDDIIFINLLSNQQPGQSEEEGLVEAQLAFEAKLLRALRQLSKVRKPQVHVVGALSQLITEGYNRDERMSGYEFINSDPDLLLEHKDSVDAIISVVKKEDLSRAELLSIDVVSGGDVPMIWLVDKTQTTIDSLRRSGSTMAMGSSFQFEDYLFRTGVRLAPELIMDLQSSTIPQVVNNGSSTEQAQMMNFPFHPLIMSNDLTPLAAKLNSPVAAYFVSPLELLEFPQSVMKEVLLSTSPYTKSIKTPRPIDFGFMQIRPNPEEYQKGPLTVGVKVEGRVKPYFQNRLTEDDRSLLSKYNIPYTLDSQYIKQVIISDADMAIPPRDKQGYFPIGYNVLEGRMYDANAELISNLLESLIDGDDILAIAQKTTSLSLIDKQKFYKSQTFYYLLLLALPLVLLFFSYIVYHWLRKRKYAV